jgi:hypothetical protein
MQQNHGRCQSPCCGQSAGSQKTMKYGFYLLLITNFFHAQVFFHEAWSNYTLTTYTAPSGISSHTVPFVSWGIFGDGWANASGPDLNPNKPFHDPLLKNTKFAVYYDAELNDTILVGTSWIDSSQYAVDRWIISPSVTVLNPNTVFTWKARSPDPNFRDGYSVYLFPSTLTVSNPSVITSSFTPAYSIPDNLSQGGGESVQWINRSLDVSSFFPDGFKFAIRHQSKNRFQIHFDDLKVVGVSYQRDASVSAFASNRCLLAGNSDSVKVLVENYSTIPINTITLAYRINNSTPYNQTFTLSTPLYFESERLFSFSLPFTYPAPGTYTLKAWVQALNGMADQYTANDTLTTCVYVLSHPVHRKSLVEISMGAKQKNSPDIMQFIQSCSSPSIVPLCMHINDSLERPLSIQWHTTFNAWNTDFVQNRYYRFSKNSFIYPSNQYCPVSANQQSLAPLEIYFTQTQYDSVSRVLTSVVNVSCAASLWGDYRIHVYLKENNVSGTMNDTLPNGFNQWNGLYTVPTSPWFQKGYYSPMVNSYILNAWQYKHMHVFRYNLTPWSGQSGIIPGNGTSAGQVYTLAVSYTIPPKPAYAQINIPENTYLIAFVEDFHSDKKNCLVWNVASQKIWNKPEVVGLENVNSPLSLWFYPNPFVDDLYIFSYNKIIKVDLYDISGKSLKCEWVQINEQSYRLKIYAPKGIYFICLLFEKGTISTLKLIKE